MLSSAQSIPLCRKLSKRTSIARIQPQRCKYTTKIPINIPQYPSDRHSSIYKANTGAIYRWKRKFANRPIVKKLVTEFQTAKQLSIEARASKADMNLQIRADNAVMAFLQNFNIFHWIRVKKLQTRAKKVMGLTFAEALSKCN